MIGQSRKTTFAMCAIVLAMAGGYAYAQFAQRAPGGIAQQQEAGPLPEPKVDIEIKDDFRIITSNGLPNHPTGKFPNRGNPNAIRAQNYTFRMPLKPKAAQQSAPRQGPPRGGPVLFGVALNGVPFDPGTAEFWNNDRRWNYEALSGKINLGVDANLAHVQPTGAYHYHGLPTGLIAKLQKKGAMTMLGYAADGFPIYSNWGYSDANDLKSPLRKLRSSYRLKEGQRPDGNDGPGGAYDGTFTVDWEYVKGEGDLDAYNGRTGVTPEYPQGTFYYVLTDEFPFIPRQYYGTPDASFQKGPPPNERGGGFGGPGFGPPPPGFGPPPPGFGPPPPGFGPPPDFGPPQN